MSLQSVRQSLAQHAPDIEIIELNQSTTTIDLATKAHNVEPGQVAKTPSLKTKNDIVLVVIKGDIRLDNKKFKSTFGAKARILSSDEVAGVTEHPAGSVRPFGLGAPVSVCCDVSLKRYAEVLSAVGVIYNVVHITPERMAKLTSATWVDACQQCSTC